MRNPALIIFALAAAVLFTSRFTPAGAATKEGVTWQGWELATFEQARREDKLIFVDVGIEGCTACRRMAEVTFTDPQVIRLLNDHFINITVDAEARPDIGDRYADWAWPALIFMAPDATQVLAIAGNRLPRNFIPILNELIDKKAGGELTADRMAPYTVAPEPVSTPLTRLRDKVRLQLDRLLNEQDGGWRDRMISTGTGPQIQHLYLRAHMYDNRELHSLALKTTDAWLNALDPVWGGVFVKAFHPGKAPPRFRNGYIPEKRIQQQANALHVFAHAFRITGDDKYRRAIAEVHRFIREWMTSEDGLFYTSQEDEPPGLTGEVGLMEYWALDSSKERLPYGVPPIDHATYTDKSSRVISGYAHAYAATGDKTCLDAATRAARTLLKDRMTSEGWMLQSARSGKVLEDDRMRPLAVLPAPFLSPQVTFGRALLDLYQVTGDKEWLEKAHTLAHAMIDKLYDRQNGGFFSTVSRETAAVIPPRKPLETNAAAAHFLYDLAVLTRDPELEAVPESTLRAVAVAEVVSREGRMVGELALALEKITAAYVEFSIVGDPGEAQAQALYDAGLSVYEPRKLLHYEKPGRYPARGRPAMYICNPQRCSLPIEDPEQVLHEARRFRGPAAVL